MTTTNQPHLRKSRLERGAGYGILGYVISFYSSSDNVLRGDCHGSEQSSVRNESVTRDSHRYVEILYLKNYIYWH